MSPRLYVDNAASQPLRPEAQEAMAHAADLLNPAGQYASGREARRVLEDAREHVAALLGADSAEVIFTGSGTEADNIAVQGLAYGSKVSRGATVIASSNIEHPAVMETVDWLTSGVVGFGFQRCSLPVDATGRVLAQQWIGAFGDDTSHGGGALSGTAQPAEVSRTSSVASPVDGVEPGDIALLTCMWANNETGVIQPVRELASFARECGIPFHTDAVQAVGHIPVDFHELGASTLAASAHKFGGPKSTGILLARRDAHILSPVRGGGQERSVRSGTVNVQGAVGCAAALASAIDEMEEAAATLRAAREQLRRVVHTIDDARIWTPEDTACEQTLPGHLHMSFPGAEGDCLIMLLDSAGVDASTGSACSAGVNRASHVLTAMGVPAEVARGALRLTIGADITDEQVEYLSTILPRVVEQARAAGMA
ncbi:cysteine desulfurase family protein [Corynebacterium anserum]|uniref:Aminotransferase class V-fold PLP-dependent enzyme n=1 Tax=Corynebacterium anserum TaxID=2684406 RepID=A0A7G7YP46_9CORY|nr:cysteine desulfurase family protein [Corynebacterium anserum]QNH96266.1 aminotransferase class V-fold PLP-dependent enzyme [Corynebacterium anserum]